MAAARRAMNGVKPTFDNLGRPPLLGYVRVGSREAEGLPNFQGRLGFARGVRRGVSFPNHICLCPERSECGKQQA